ncbi:hypothetical protein SmJEL517_g00561 [Synchytrium microbalum]|uniref:Uncharacterized protein n=1 Tax=Synchytrium microbalum TaxID=1806994 RepID=A0A507CHG4_9FUNG|nr:uncharacterized protein SmJEL517_g00561 [Synchytrium microbalum]TPX37474.1 hypothetical protein SmJEL517_g00561 [Synchytrium microbalum]
MAATAMSGMPGLGFSASDDARRLLRLRLDQLGYSKEVLPPEAAGLVQKLLSDLIVTTDTARRFKFEKEAAEAERRTVEDQVAPLRQEIARITAENNRLHSDVIASAAELDATRQRATQTVRRLESEREDLKFMVSQHMHRAEMEMKKAETERAKVAEMLLKQGVIQDGNSKISGGRKQPSKAAERLFSQIQKIDLETGLEPLQNPSTAFLGPDPVIADALRMAEARAEQLSKIKDDLSSKNIDLENQACHSLKEQVGRREQESARLGAQLEVARAQQFSTVPPGARPLHEIRDDGTSETAGIRDLTVARQRIEQLEMQVEYLQEHADGLEKELASYESGQQTMLAIKEDERLAMKHELDREKERGDGLLKNLSRLETMLNELQGLKAASPRRQNVDSKVSRSKSKDERDKKEHVSKIPIRQVADLTDKLKSTEALLKSTNHQLSSLRAEFDMTSQEAEVLRSDLATANATIGQLQNDLQMVRHSPIPHKRPNTPKRARIQPDLERDSQMLDEYDISEIRIVPDTMKPGLESENEELRQRVHDLESEKGKFEADLQGLHQELMEVQKKTFESDDRQLQIESLERQIASKNEEVKMLNRRLEDVESRGALAMASQDKLIAELEQVKKERDELVKSLEQFESHLAEVQHGFDTLSSDRDNIAQLYEQATEELRTLRNAHALSVTHPSSPIPPADINALRARVELLRAKERSLESKVVELEKSNDILAKDLKAANERVPQSRVAESTAARDAAAPSAESERELNGIRAELSDKVQEIERLNSKIGDMEAQRERQNVASQEVKSRLIEAESRLERVQSDLSRAIHERDEQSLRMTEQRRLLTQVDRERDVFQADMDSKAEKIVELQAIVSRMKEDSRRMETEYMALRDQADALASSLNEQDREISSLQRQVESLANERDHFSIEAQRNAEEARNVGSDLVALTKENQVLNGELSEAIAERDHLRNEMVEAERQNNYLEEVARGREQEKDVLMVSYRKLIAEHEKLEGSIRAVNEDGNNMRMEMIMKDKRGQHLQNQLDELTAEAAQLRIDLGSYEKQCSNLTRTLAAAERSVRHLEADKARLLRDVQAARDVALSVDRAKDDFQRQATSSIVEKEHLNGAIRRLEAEKESFESQVRSERLKVERLEHLLAAERTRHLQAQQQALQQAAKDAGKPNLEDQVQQLSQQQTASIAALSRELRELEEDRKTLLAKVADSDRAEHEAQEAYMMMAEKCTNLEKDLVEMKERIDNKEQIIEELVAMRTEVDKDADDTSQGKSDVERKVEAELEKTKAQLRKYEVQLARRQRRRDDIDQDEHFAQQGGLKVYDSYTSRSRASDAEESGGEAAVTSSADAGGGASGAGPSRKRDAPSSKESSPSSQIQGRTAGASRQSSRKLLETIAQVQNDFRK